MNYLVSCARSVTQALRAQITSYALMSSKMKAVFPSLFFASALTALATADAQPQSASLPAKPLKLGVVQDKSQFDGCGCSFFLNLRDEKRQRAIFLSDLSHYATINLDGKDLILQLTHNSVEKKGDARIGDRSWETYSLGNIKLRIDYTITKLCDPHDEGCEVTYYNATITVTQIGQKVLVKTIGSCGC